MARAGGRRSPAPARGRPGVPGGSLPGWPASPPADVAARLPVTCLVPDEPSGCPRRPGMNLADAIVPSAAAEVAVLDSAGIVVWVNDPWTRFAQDNGAPPGWTGVGSSYLDICDTAGDPPSLAVARALRAALRGELAGWAAIEVPCHSPTEDRWFDIVIGPRFDDSGRSVGASVTIARLSRHDAPPLQRPPAAITETPPARQPT